MSGRPQHSDGATAIGERREAPPKLTREDVAKIEIGQTDIPRWLAVGITLMFLLAIIAVPVSQHVYELARAEKALQMYDIVRHSDRVGSAWANAEGGPYRKLFAANAEALRQINDYEDALEDASWMTQALLGPVTEFQVSYFGAGNEEAYIGRDGWLFYRLDVDHVMGPGFLDPRRLQRRASGGNEFQAAPQPDPRKAIIQFRDQLAQRGIDLIVLPVPVKPTASPQRFTSRYRSRQQPLHNASFDPLMVELRAADVTVLDPSELLAGPDTYLQSDTHWTPEAMQRVAAALAAQVRQLVPITSAHTDYQHDQIQVSNLGDIAAMLKLPSDQSLFEPQTVTVRSIRFGGEPWQSSREASVLLLGDSFTNIYAMADLKWDEHAGLAAQLSYELRTPVDVIAINAGGAHAARQALVADMIRGNDRLAGKQVVIWQFAARELSHGDWKLMDLPEVDGTKPPDHGPAQVGTIVTATISAKTAPPRPGSVPYRDAVIAVRLQNVQGENIADDLLVYTMGMRDNKLVDSPWQVGRTVKVRLTPWADAEKQYGSYNRFELDDPDALFLDAYWGEVIQ